MRQVLGLLLRADIRTLFDLNLLRIHLRDTYANGKPVPRQGNRSVNAAPSNIYRCRPFGPNDYVFVHCATVEMWRTLTMELRDVVALDERVAFAFHFDAETPRRVESAAPPTVYRAPEK